VKTNNYRLRLDLHAKVVVEAEAYGLTPARMLARIVEDYFRSKLESGGQGK
jgi:hypothetical protein